MRWKTIDLAFTLRSYRWRKETDRKRRKSKPHDEIHGAINLRVLRRATHPNLDVHFVAAKNDGDVFADADQIPMPVGDVLVRHTG